MRTKYLLFIFLLLGTTSCKKITELLISKINIEGTYINDESFIGSVTFVGESTALINWMGFELAGSYEKDGILIKVNSGGYNLLFETITSDSLVGKGFLEKGYYIKKK